MATNVRPGQPYRAQFAVAVGGESSAEEDVAVDVEALTVQGRARTVGDGGAGAVQLSGDVGSSQPHRAQFTGAMSGEACAEEDAASDMEGTGP